MLEHLRLRSRNRPRDVDIHAQGKDAIEAGEGVEVQQGQVAGDLRTRRIGSANVRLHVPKAAQALIDGRVVGFQQWRLLEARFHGYLCILSLQVVQRGCPVHLLVLRCRCRYLDGVAIAINLPAIEPVPLGINHLPIDDIDTARLWRFIEFRRRFRLFVRSCHTCISLSYGCLADVKAHQPEGTHYRDQAGGATYEPPPVYRQAPLVRSYTPTPYSLSR